MSENFDENKDIRYDINGNEIKYEGNSNLKPINCIMPLTEWHIKEIQKCKDDIIYFAENYFYIIDLDVGKVKIKLRDYQKDLLIKFQKNRFNIVLASRQIGKTTVYTIFALWYAFFHSDKFVAILGNKLETAVEILGRIKMAYEEMPHWLKQGLKSYNQKSVKFENGSKIIASSTSSSALRGMSINVLILDEFAFISPNIYNDFVSSTFPVISSSKKSKIIIVSTLDGKNHFWKMFREAQENKSSFVATEVKWNQIPERDEKWKEDMIKTIGKERFMEEYDNIPNASDTNALIPLNILNKLDFQHPIDLNNTDLMNRLFDLVSVEKRNYIENYLNLYEINKKNNIYSIGIDTSRMNKDKNLSSDAISIQILNISQYPIKQVGHFFVIKDFDWFDLPEIVNAIGIIYNNAYVFIENNDIGLEIGRSLFVDFEYENIYFEKNGEPGFRTTKRTRNIGVNKLKSLITSNNLILNDYETIFELSTFLRKGNGKYEAKEGHYDDAVMSLIASLFFFQTKELKDIIDEFQESPKNNLNMQKNINNNERERIPPDFFTNDEYDFLNNNRIF